MIETKKYITDNFLFTNDHARLLYERFARHLPIVDFHNHLNPSWIADNRQPENISRLWVTVDPYKHRAMRINGIPEEGITGSASDYEKFRNWAKTLPKTLGNPLYQWSYLELYRIFGIEKELNEHSAEEIWDACNKKIMSSELSIVSLNKKLNVEALYTSDDLLDDISVHQKASKHRVAVLPSLRTDSILDQSENFKDWCNVLESLTITKIEDLDSYETALEIRLDVFDKAGCRMADQALDADFQFLDTDKSKANTCFKQLLSREGLTVDEAISLKSYLLVQLGKTCSKRNWILQLHIGAQRKTSTRLKKLVGSAGGYAAIGRTTDVAVLVEVLDTLDKKGNLPKTILYNLNPVDNAALASLTGSFSEDGVAGKIQFGPAWWYNDHYSGITNQLTALANHGLLHHFVGMTTDSRSFLSLSRHEYFRRVFCEWISDWVKKGLFPNDESLLGGLIEAVCYGNTKKWILNDKK